MRALGVDIGGTFTDLVLLDPESGRVLTHKLLTTPEDPVRAVLDGVRALVARAKADDGDTAHAAPKGIGRVVHGTTLVTNAVVERKGARTALLTTRGFRDVLEIRREGRYDLYDLEPAFPEPLVPRRRRFEAEERLDETGRALIPLDEEALAALLDGLADAGIESWAVCFLHAYADPAHEQRAGEILARRFPGLPVSLSSRVAPEIREYERTSTTVANAYVRPVAEGYLRRLGTGLQEALPDRPALHLMQSDGGIIHPDTAAELPIRIVESGPAGGVMAAARLAASLDLGPVLSLDMGGTTAKLAFLDAGGPRTRSTFEMDRRRFYRKGSGLPVLVPSLDLVEIGAGGGSIARRGPLGTLTVGPESAGASPGPACYGGGGTEATVTDADLVLGLLNPGYFLGGAMALDAEAAARAVTRGVAEPMGLDPLAAAHGVFTTVGSNMAEAARVHAAERGLDLARHTLIAFGGAGPVHAWSVARELRIPRVLFPSHAGVESALGFLAAPAAFEAVRSQTGALGDLDVAAARRVIDDLAREAREAVAAAGIGAPSVTLSADMRYRGQGAEVRVRLPGLDVGPDALETAFHETYRALHGRAVSGVAVEIVTWRVRAEAPAPRIPVFDAAGREEPAAEAPAPFARRRAGLPGLDAPAEVAVYRRGMLRPGMRLRGPLLIEESQSTLVLGDGSARVLSGGAVLAEVAW